MEYAELGLIQLPEKCDSSHVQGEETEAQRSQQLAELTTLNAGLFLWQILTALGLLSSCGEAAMSALASDAVAQGRLGLLRLGYN